MFREYSVSWLPTSKSTVFGKISVIDYHGLCSQDAGSVAKAALQASADAAGPYLLIEDGKFSDYRWKDGRWVLSKFTDAEGNTDWDKVIASESIADSLLCK